MQFLNQCSALITGASAGLGAEFARQLAPEAKTLVLIARRLENLEALRCELARPGLEIHLRKVDLSSEADIEAFLDWVRESGLQINFLVNNAGLGDHGRFEESDHSRVREMIDVNIHALTRLSFALLPLLKKQPIAAILNVSSVASFLPMPKMAVYAATKAYVSSFSEALRAELRSSTVRVTNLCPGPVSTEFGKVAERLVNPDPVPAPAIMKVPAAKVVAEALEAVERDQPRRIPGWFVAFVMLLTAAMPMFILRLTMKGQAQR
jgi:short-subunit dehydrogenase